jgi:protein TonB
VQVVALAVLIMVPLIYTQVLPQARLRSVFAAPLPPPPPVPTVKAPLTTRTTSTRSLFQPPPTQFREMPISSPGEPKMTGVAAPAIDGVAGGDADSTVNIAAILAKPPDPPPPAANNKRVRVASMEPSQLIHQVQPEYPRMAKQVHVQGVVEFTAVISKTGTIENLQLVHGHPLLVAAAREAILQWRYKPTLLGGEPVEVITNIVVNFTLNEQ